MNQKVTAFLAAVLLKISSVTAAGNSTNQSLGNLTDAGYVEVVREAGNMQGLSLEHMQAVWDAFGIPIAVVAFAPTVAVFLVGAALEGEWGRKNYQILVILSLVVSFLGVVGFPILLMHL